ncbi:hypothetical protein HPB49_015334 [Dermacentor silvarum]|uniref:Uncharacterized protein n=1 Tax=Dermacentor silvarum TaxID=543639 RepID=A0ACB8E192_DERSI|nr:hypothetical protein HPB49_015334 [Dermacentor silvarum]
MDPKELFPSWFEALSHSARSSWRDQKSWLYDETSTFAYYNGFFNTLIVPTLLLSHPLFYAGGPAALNYGGLGTTIGHEITHIFDVYLKMSKENSNLEPGFKEEFMKRIECLRASGRAPVEATAGREAVNSTLDSIELANFVAVTTAYKAFLLLLNNVREKKLSNLNLSAKQLFFINYCVKLCDETSAQTTGYSSFRSRCMVPLMNMPDFSEVFGCAPGASMNPRRKCALW